jgi:hypothetical protein
LIEYLGGCKGELFCRFLNKDTFIKDIYNRFPSFIKDENDLRKISQLANTKGFNKDYDVSYFRRYFDQYDAGKKFLRCHDIENIFPLMELFTKHNIQVVKIKFHKESYANIFIEGTLKNIDRPAETHYYYTMDKELLDNDVPLNDTHRCEWLYKRLKGQDDQRSRHFQSYDHFNKKLFDKHKKIIYYEDIFLKLDLEHEIFQDVDTEDYKNFVSQTWLPEKIILFGQEWYPKDYGYEAHI